MGHPNPKALTQGPTTPPESTGRITWPISRQRIEASFTWQFQFGWWAWNRSRPVITPCLLFKGN